MRQSPVVDCGMTAHASSRARAGRTATVFRCRVAVSPSGGFYRAAFRWPARRNRFPQRDEFERARAAAPAAFPTAERPML